jgi:hypothetical protein
MIYTKSRIKLTIEQHESYYSRWWTLTQRNDNLTMAGGELGHRGMTTLL